jgi:hypothetical protein
MRKRSTKYQHHRHHVKVLKAEVMSGRIAWLNFLDALRATAKLCVILAAIFAIAYGIKKVIQHTFHENPDFQLQAINLNQNDLLNEVGLIELLDIDLTANIFDIDVEELESKLKDQPAIRSARVERNLPGTLDVQISTRKPIAWVTEISDQTDSAELIPSLLVDDGHYVYACPQGQRKTSQALPTIELKKLINHPLKENHLLKHPEYRNTLRLLGLIKAEFPEQLTHVKRLSQPNDWSLHLSTSEGTLATFGLGDHKRQMSYLVQALDAARDKNYVIETINVIPQRNVPITIRKEAPVPRAILVPDTQPLIPN